MYIDMGGRMAGKQARPSLIIEDPPPPPRAPEIAQNCSKKSHFGPYGIMKNWFSIVFPHTYAPLWWGLHLLTFWWPWILCFHIVIWKTSLLFFLVLHISPVWWGLQHTVPQDSPKLKSKNIHTLNLNSKSDYIYTLHIVEAIALVWNLFLKTNISKDMDLWLIWISKDPPANTMGFSKSSRYCVFQEYDNPDDLHNNRPVPRNVPHGRPDTQGKYDNQPRRLTQ